MQRCLGVTTIQSNNENLIWWVWICMHACVDICMHVCASNSTALAESMLCSKQYLQSLLNCNPIHKSIGSVRLAAYWVMSTISTEGEMISSLFMLEPYIFCNVHEWLRIFQCFLYLDHRRWDMHTRMHLCMSVCMHECIVLYVCMHVCIHIFMFCFENKISGGDVKSSLDSYWWIKFSKIYNTFLLRSWFIWAIH